MTDYRAELQRLVKAYDEHGGRWPDEDVRALHNAVKTARAALAQPEPGAVTDEELLGLDDLRDAWNAQADAANSWDELGIDEIIWFAQQQALARWGRPAIKPVPVSERLPGPEDCDEEGRCWIGMWNESDGEQIPDWELSTPAHYTWKGITAISCWLPHHALPLPTP